jgi:DNA-binding NtrC family response regulator
MPRRSQLGMLRKYLAGAQTPLALFAQGDRLVWCNGACGTWFGVPSAALWGRKAVRHVAESADLAERVAAALAPPLAATEGTTVRRFTELPTPHGLKPAWLTFCPLQVDPQSRAVLVVVEATASSVREPDDGLPMRSSAIDQLEQQLVRMRDQLRQWFSTTVLLGQSPAITRARTQLELAARTGARTVIVGPVGSGRELLARRLYVEQTPGAAWPLIPLPCQLLDAELLTTTVVSYVRSRWEFGHPTRIVLLLLEVDSLSSDAQWALWELLQRPVYPWHTLATVQESLLGKAARGEYRSDLANYLSTITIELPKLRDRSVDIPLLVQRLIESLNARTGRSVEGLSAEALERLSLYTWPGEWAELTRIVEEAHRSCQGSRIEVQDLPQVLQHALHVYQHPPRAPEPIQLDETLDRIEREILRRALQLTKGNRARAAKLLGISRPRLLRRLEQLGLSERS